MAVLGVGLFAAAATPILRNVAKEEVLQSSRIMMESAAGARKYTSEQIAPRLVQREKALARSRQELCARLGEHIPAERDRKTFLRDVGSG